MGEVVDSTYGFDTAGVFFILSLTFLPVVWATGGMEIRTGMGRTERDGMTGNIE